MKVESVVDAPNFVFFHFQPGKPDPQEPCSLETLEAGNRSPVLQTAHKNNVCWYYAFNMIRDRIGKNPSDELVEARNVEVLCSQRRKDMTLYENETRLPPFVRSPEKGRDVLTQMNHSFVKEMVESWEGDWQTTIEPKVTEDNPSVYPMLQEFLSQSEYDNCYDYFYFRQFSPKFQINEAFLMKVGLSAEALFEKARSKDPVNYSSKLGSRKWENIPYSVRASLADAYATQVTAELYGLKLSSWSPFQPVDSLICELREKGPLVIGGSYGAAVYKEPCFKIKDKVQGFDVFGWRPGTRKSEPVGHAITVVGARKLGSKELVYYVDPSDASDPLSPMLQKLYVISYQSLKENAKNSASSWISDVRESPAGYAWSSNRFKQLSI